MRRLVAGILSFFFFDPGHAAFYHEFLFTQLINIEDKNYSQCIMKIQEEVSEKKKGYCSIIKIEKNKKVKT